MAFWLFFTAMDLLIPGIMVGIGARFLKHPPGTVNAWYGYRTARSMKNQETWDFAHETCGKLWVRLGKLSFLPALLAAALTFGCGIETVSVASIVVVTVQTLVLIGSIFPVERALKRNFDDSGRKRS